ncbi:diacylglycerol o-acyltransferase [Raphidocelis subcapitata]|uniref:diacylglycerol O-acyltransferase n=1 Tax=Raphidocelis subcapitata TaxID=307507 RepID=A0A2V0NWJ2_9CHLO|nr:diacylglycerol o-acyltransferase [Raphidocelis subcapitata]|eukprot:GBF89940.1 diacylglycerol o-acyltransferase [Raphidocelis subcapitata]
MLPWLGPDVAAAPFGVRAFAYTSLWVGHWFATQTVIWAILKVYQRYGWVKKNTRDPSLPLWHMLAADVFGYYSWAVGAGVVHAWYNPTWESWDYSFPYVKLFWLQLPILMAYDTWFFFVHRAVHINKWAFRHIHGMHHRSDAYLNVTSNSFEHPLDGFAVVGLPVGLVAWLGCWLGNWWALLIPLHTIACIFVFGHSGYELKLVELHEVALLAVNPMLLIQLVTPNSARPMDHEDHHTNPRVNFSLFFTFWDDLYDTAYPKRARCAVFSSLVSLAFYVLGTFFDAWVMYAPASLAAALAVHALTPLPAACYRLLGGAAARATTRLAAWDRLRREHLVSYAEKGAPGAFAADPARRYIFCYQPMGVQARGAWYTFAGKGRDSPVSGLHTVKLAVGRWIWPLPGVQQLLALYDCCDSSYATLKALLTDKVPKSVCITVGGFREAKYLQTYAVAVKCRKGFARLAAETGAALVPVVGVGETFLAGEPTFAARIFKLIVPFRPYPLQVVFGEPITPLEGESVAALHERYCAALLLLGKEHGVPLQIAE